LIDFNAGVGVGAWVGVAVGVAAGTMARLGLDGIEADDGDGVGPVIAPADPEQAVSASPAASRSPDQRRLIVDPLMSSTT